MRLILAAAALALVAGCQQPADEPENPAVDSTPMADAGQADGANSFTESQARGAIEGAGYTDVQTLTKDDGGVWRGMATKGGSSTAVSVDYRGSVTVGDQAAAASSSSMMSEKKEN